VTNYIGGYAEPRTIYFIFIFGSVGMACAVIIPFVSYFWVVSILLWMVLFFGGAMVPGLTGMIMASISP
jgi:ABC-type transport system involved in multi-copper enzyme maturation permease subunit